MTEIESHIMFSEACLVTKASDHVGGEAVCSEACFSPGGSITLVEWGGKTFCSLEAFIT